MMERSRESSFRLDVSARATSWNTRRLSIWRESMDASCRRSFLRRSLMICGDWSAAYPFRAVPPLVQRVGYGPVGLAQDGPDGSASIAEKWLHFHALPDTSQLPVTPLTKPAESSAPDMHHAARRLEKSWLSNMMPSLLVLDDSANPASHLIVRCTAKHEAHQIVIRSARTGRSSACRRR